MKPVFRPGRPRVGAGASAAQTGAVLVELAMILPFLALTLVVIADLGLVLREHQVLGNAAREGARFSSLPKNWVAPQNPGASLAAIQQYVVDYCDRAGVQVAGAEVDVDQGVLIAVDGGTVSASRVTVTVDRNLLFPAAGLLGSPTVRLRGEAVFRNFHSGG